MTVAALYVDARGVYAGVPGVEVWGVERDARRYAGPHPFVGHPPCERWGRYWSGGPSNHGRFQLGDDGGCFAACLASVRRWGGVIEHPEASHAWRVFGLNAPPKCGGWVNADFLGGWTCCVEQGHYGHRARKATWLYAHGVDLPDLRWGSSGTRGRLEDGYHSAEERRRSVRRGCVEVIAKSQRAVTPPRVPRPAAFDRAHRAAITVRSLCQRLSEGKVVDVQRFMFAVILAVGLRDYGLAGRLAVCLRGLYAR